MIFHKISFNCCSIIIIKHQTPHVPEFWVGLRRLLMYGEHTLHSLLCVIMVLLHMILFSLYELQLFLDELGLKIHFFCLNQQNNNNTMKTTRHPKSARDWCFHCTFDTHHKHLIQSQFMAQHTCCRNFFLVSIAPTQPFWDEIDFINSSIVLNTTLVCIALHRIVSLYDWY